MRIRNLTTYLIPTMLLIGLAWLTPAAFAAPPKVEICHIPPGNPDNFHTITISENAFSAHLAHGDLSGACDAVCADLCDDEDACTIDDSGDCEQNGCPATPELVDCSDSNECTMDSCDPLAGCVNDPLTGESCDDGAICTGPDTCSATGECIGSAIGNCCLDDGACSQDLCDGAFCNLSTNRCVEVPVECIAPDACTITECAPDTGECVDSAVVCAEGQVCDLDFGSCVDDCVPGLFEEDLVDPAFPPGNMLLLKDTIAGKEWLDLTATVNRSANCIQGGCDGWLGRGFNYPTATQIQTLWQHAGIVNDNTGGTPTPGNIPAAQFLLGAMGVTAPPDAARGIFSGCFTGSCISYMDRSNGLAIVVADPIHTSIVAPDIGSWLVRDGEVCE